MGCIHEQSLRLDKSKRREVMATELTLENANVSLHSLTI